MADLAGVRGAAYWCRLCNSIAYAELEAPRNFSKGAMRIEFANVWEESLMLMFSF